MSYQLCVELGQPWLTLAIEDQESVYHLDGQCARIFTLFQLLMMPGCS